MRSAGNRIHTCVVCGAKFRNWTDHGVYCGRACMTVGYRTRMSGAGNPAWRGGKWKYKGRKWSTIASSVVLRDGSCADCGTVDGLLAHHLVPQRFWIDLDAANQSGNLLTLCSPCHGRRPEHFWKRLPDAAYVKGAHIRHPVARRTSGDHLRPYPACIVCGDPCKRHRSRFCSYACSNRARWSAGLYDRDALAARAADAARARWQRL